MGQDIMNGVGKLFEMAQSAGKMVGEKAKDAGTLVIKSAENIVDAAKNIEAKDVVTQAIKLPGVHIDRRDFLYKELIKYYPEDVVTVAIEKNPAQAGISEKHIKKIADTCISYETSKVTAISAAAGLPGGIAMAATIPGDLVQYFGFMLRAAQKLIYLYGFNVIEVNEENLDDETMNQLLIYLGVMFGVQGANEGIRIISKTFAEKTSKTLANKALTKGAVYPIVKAVAKALGFRMTKQIFANGVSKVVPVVGAVASGTITYMSFKPCCKKLEKTLASLELCKPDFYEVDVVDTEILIEDVDEENDEKTKLVAYFSASGVTKIVAEKMSEVLCADIYEILPKVPYSDEDLDWKNDKSRTSVEMKDKSYRPELKCFDANIESYDVIYLGFPIWWYVAPTIINTFLEAYDFSGKEIILFATSGSSGFGDTLKELEKSCEGADIREGAVVKVNISEEEIQSKFGI